MREISSEGSVRSIGHLFLGILPGMATELVDLGFGDESKQRDRDIALLMALTGEPDELLVLGRHQRAANGNRADRLRAGKGR